jgi:hypothetical protein
MRPLIYTPGKKYSNTLIFSLDKIVRRKCSIIGRNLLKILPECFKLNHWHIERHTLHSKIEIKCCTIHKLKMCHLCGKKMSLENYWYRYREFHHLSTICTPTESLDFEISYQAKQVSNECNLHSHGWLPLIVFSYCQLNDEFGLG